MCLSLFKLELFMTDNVLQPKHYMQGSHECIDEIKAMLTPEEFKGFLKGNVIKYRYRANLKNGEEDLAKADNYAYYLINGHFKTKADFDSRKDELAFNKLNDLMQGVCIAIAVCTLIKENYLSNDTLKTNRKNYSLIDLTKTRELNSEHIYLRHRIHFTDGSKMDLLIERGFTLKAFFTTKCCCNATGAKFLL